MWFPDYLEAPWTPTLNMMTFNPPQRLKDSKAQRPKPANNEIFGSLGFGVPLSLSCLCCKASHNKGCVTNGDLRFKRAAGSGRKSGTLFWGTRLHGCTSGLMDKAPPLLWPFCGSACPGGWPERGVPDMDSLDSEISW